MKPYSKEEAPESKLEDLIRNHPGLIEDGLIFVDHQNQVAGKRLDVLLKDNCNALVVAELKVGLDDGMLIQVIDYYDYVTKNVETFARLYKDSGIDPTKPVRVMLIAPAFSQLLLNRCKWLTPRISLFTVQCLRFVDDADIVPIFTEVLPPSTPPSPARYTIAENFDYITDPTVKNEAQSLLAEIKGWKGVSNDPIQGAISMKVNGRVFGYFQPRRKHYILSTYGPDNVWTDYAIKNPDDSNAIKQFLAVAFESLAAK